jgi:hypothetical protein
VVVKFPHDAGSNFLTMQGRISSQSNFFAMQGRISS